MGRLLFKVAGESHGPALIALLSALPAGLKYPESLVKNWLRLRRTVAGRGPRSGTETDQVEIISGFTDGKANGGPVSLLIRNQDSGGRSSTPEGHNQSLEFPRPGHADFAGAKKWGLTDASVVAELASARLTAAYTASGALAQGLLETVGISTLACVTRLGPIKLRPENWVTGSDLSGAIRKADQSRFLALDQGREEAMTQALSQAETQGDTLGGEFAVVVAPLPAGLGISQPLEERLDARFGQCLMGIPGIVAVSLGQGFEVASQTGRKYHDGYLPDGQGSGTTHSNRGGGLAGGMTTGQPLVLRCRVKPLASLGNPLPSFSLRAGDAGPASRVRGDISAVAPAAVVARALVALVLADTLWTSRGGDSIDEFIRNHTT